MASEVSSAAVKAWGLVGSSSMIRLEPEGYGETDVNDVRCRVIIVPAMVQKSSGYPGKKGSEG